MQEKKDGEERKIYGLSTAISMIVGIVVGSGIYFKADDILGYTNGNLGLGLLVLTLGAFCIIFGSLTLADLAKRYTSKGGLVGYYERFISREMASAYGWFQLYVWLPTISVVVGWAGAIYTFMLLGIEASLLEQILLGIFYNIIFIVINSISRRAGGLVQRLATGIKLLPLIVIAIYGIFFAGPVDLAKVNSSGFMAEFSKFSWLSALVPLAFIFDGWTISMTIGPEVVNPKKNLTKALVISPLFVLIVYLVYILSLSRILGGQEIINLGDASIFVAAHSILGPRAGNIILVVVIISILGVVNGIELGAIRVPQAMAEMGMISDPKGKISKLNPKTQISTRSVMITILLNVFWAVLHFIVMKYELFAGRDISEISIVFSYLMYIILYIEVFKLLKKEKRQRKLWLPIAAIIGSLIIFVGSILASPFYVSLFVVICSLVCLMGYRYMGKKAHKIEIM